MYNLLVTGQSEAWKSSEYLYPRSRFLEYTEEKISKRFKNLTNDDIENLKSFPCLFMYENRGENTNVYIGFIKEIRVRDSGSKLLIEFEINFDIDIKFSSIEHLFDLLDIREWEIYRTHWAVKNDNLLKRFEDNLIINLKEKEKLLNKIDNMKQFINNEILDLSNGKRLVESDKTNESGKITTLRGFIDKVLTLDKKNNIEIFYRGHSDKDRYKLEPSLFRKDEEGNYLYLENEDKLYRELIASNPSEFLSDKYTIDILMRMQHYSLPTRLLDITSNSLIALYFACKSNLDKKGEIIIFYVKKDFIKYFDSDTASCISNLVRLPKEEKDKILFELDRKAFNEQISIKRLIHFIKEEKSFFESKIEVNDLKKIICIKGKRSNDRITSQSGAFLLFGLDSIFQEIGTEDISISRIIIENKEKILKELDQLNINESTVFPYIENSAKYVANKFKFEKS
ncbi:FRG domain-containing protein [Aliarcobacter butzleri]|uniref:FRG domain-containing protein n=1 Tax=Aliarcobacter butzleri TaxID=28197 RepID=UPI0021B4A121|nr:FRG domain-containing protein [Aliarcobacter butzleri]MCT7610016.1 FRG domain-containing protein [Aliarcobacter butzleri]